MRNSENWFKTKQIDENTFVISEPGHWEETNCYLLIGTEKVLLIDTGLGVCNISDEVRKLTDKPVSAVPTHIHWDHIGGLRHFTEFYVHEAEAEWVSGKFPLSVEIVRKQLVKGKNLPEDFDAELYDIFKGKPTAEINNSWVFNLGGRTVKVIETPGHSPGHMCFFEEEKGYLFTGDLVYEGTLFANYPSTDPEDYLESLKKIAKIPVKRIFPAHHSLEIKPEIIIRMRDALLELNEKGLLCHGSGMFDFEEWSILL